MNSGGDQASHRGYIFNAHNPLVYVTLNRFVSGDELDEACAVAFLDAAAFIVAAILAFAGELVEDKGFHRLRGQALEQRGVSDAACKTQHLIECWVSVPTGSNPSTERTPRLGSVIRWALANPFPRHKVWQMKRRAFEPMAGVSGPFQSVWHKSGRQVS